MQSICKTKYSNYKLESTASRSPPDGDPKRVLMRWKKNKNKELIYIFKHSQETAVADSEN